MASNNRSKSTGRAIAPGSYRQVAVTRVASNRSSVSGRVVNSSRGKPENADFAVFMTVRSAIPASIVVSVSRRVRDRRFHKFLTRRVKYKAHDEKNECHVGDRVRIMEIRPISKQKRWRVVEVVEKAR